MTRCEASDPRRVTPRVVQSGAADAGGKESPMLTRKIGRTYAVVLVLVIAPLVLAGCATQTPVAGGNGVAPSRGSASAKAAGGVALADIQFAVDRYDIQPRYQPALDKAAGWLRANPGAQLVIEGHCDESGAVEYNHALGERRAQATRDYLVARGVDPGRISVVSYGEERPACSAHTDECRTRNRRAHLVASPTVPAPTAEGRAALARDVQTALALARARDASLPAFLGRAYGYAVFPTVGKGAIGLGAAHGEGEVYERGKKIGYADLTQGTIGLQLGGQTYTEIIAFQNKAALDDFKNGDRKFAGQASAVAIKAGAGANAGFTNGVSVLTMGEQGFMLEASLGAQSFTFEPL
jgi:peptidoglycan-associated lipoprotein